MTTPELPVPPPPPPTRPPLKMPLSFAAKWRRNWRITAEAVDTGLLQLRDEGVLITGRRTNAVRGAVYLALRTAWTSLSFAFACAVMLTALGITWRSQQLGWLVIFPMMIFPFQLVGGWVFRKLLRRYTEPYFSVVVPWDRVRHLSSSGGHVVLDLDTREHGVISGQFAPKRPYAQQRQAMGQLEQEPFPPNAARRQKIRPVWIDKLALLAGPATVLATAPLIEPHLSAWLMSGGPTHGPLAGIPDAVTPAQLDARTSLTCAPPPGGPKITNQRNGADLSWTVDGDADGWEVAVLRWRPGTGRIELVDIVPARARQLGAGLDDSTIGVTVSLRHDDARAVRALLTSGDLETLHAAWCGGLLGRLDFTVAPRPAAPTLRVWRDGDDLLVQPAALDGQYRVLAVRWRDTPEPDLFDHCEIPQADGQLGLRPATPVAERFEDFFKNPRDLARVYLIPEARAREISDTVGRGGSYQRCLVPDSLLWGGQATVRATLGVEEVSQDLQLLRQRASRAARMLAPLPVHPSAADLELGLVHQYEAVLGALGESRNPDEQRALNAGVLDAISWSDVLDTLSMTDSLPRLERLRQRLNARDPGQQMGDTLLIALGQQFMARTPVHQEYVSRILIGEAWLVKPGTTWTLDGRAVTISQEAAETWQIIGRYILLDCGRQLEADINAGRLGLFGASSSLVPQLMLMTYDVTIDIEQSSTRKLLSAWATGDFEYIIDRVLKKTQEQLTDQDQAIARIRREHFSLDTQWTNGTSVRMSHLVRQGGQMGWVAQFDGRHLRTRFGPREIYAREQPLLAMAGSYVTGALKPSGLAVEDGRVTNYTITPKLGGLVILGVPAQPLAILDMRKGGRLPGDQRELRPLQSLDDFDYLLRYLARHKASAFQTHVLYADGAPRIEQGRSAPDKRERRLLVDARYKDNQIVTVVDLPSMLIGYSLFEAMEITRNALESPPPGPGLHVEGIANLDVGAFDILRAVNDQGAELRGSPKSVDQAQNLITLTL